MAFRTLEVSLRANVGPYLSGLAQASQATKRFGDDVDGQGRRTASRLDAIGKVGMGVGAGLLVGFGVAANASMGFERELSNLQAVTQATGQEMGQLRQQALDAGAATVFSASQAAQAQAELAKAGMATRDILSGGLTAALDLAAAGNLDLARAAGITAQALTVFNLEGSQASTVADALAAGANKSTADVDDLALAMQQSALVADQMDLSVEETVGTLSMFSANALNGSDAGTSFKTMLQRLTPQSAEAASTMRELGLDFFEANGEFVGIERVAGQLQERLGHLSDEQRATALTTLFGADAVRAATILMEGGAEAVRHWTGEVSEQGYAADLAATKLDNLAGDLEALRGSIETTLVGSGSHANGVLRGLVQTTTDLVNGMGAVPAPVQQAGMALLGFGGVALSVGGGAAYLGPKVAAARASLAGMGAVGAATNTALGKMAPTLGIAGVSLSAYAILVARAHERTAALLDEATRDLDLTALDDMATGLQRIQEVAQQIVDERDSVWEVITAGPEGWANFAFGVRDVVSAYDELRVQTNFTALQQKAMSANVRSAATEMGLSEAAVRTLAETYDVDLAQSLGEVLPALEGAHAEMIATTQAQAEGEGRALDYAEATGKVREELEALTPVEKLAREEFEKWLAAVEGTSDAFVDPVGTFNTLLQDNAQAMADNANEMNEWWNATHDGTDRAALSWEDFADRATVSMDEYVKRLEEQVAAQEEWRVNLGSIAMRAGKDVADELATWGPGAAEFIAGMADATGEEFTRLEEIVRDRMGNAAEAVDHQTRVMEEYGRQGATATAQSIVDAVGGTPEDVRRILAETNGLLAMQMAVMDELARQGARATYESIGAELGLTPGEVRSVMSNANAEASSGMRVMEEVGRLGAGATVWQIADRLNVAPGIVRAVTQAAGYELQEGMNPLLTAVGASRVQVYARAHGGVLYDAYGAHRVDTSGDVPNGHQPEIAPAGSYRLFGERQTGGEAYTPRNGDPRMAWETLSTAAGWYGWTLAPRELPGEFMVRAFATGGVVDFANMFMSSADLPPTPEFDPLAFPMEPTYQAGWQHMLDEVGGWIDRTLTSTAFAGDAGGLNPILLGKFNLWNALTGGHHTIVSGYRSYAEQAALYARYLAGDPSLTLVAPPGRSNHQLGLAIDHSPVSNTGTRAVGYGLGLHWPVPREPWHMEVVGMPRGFTPYSYANGGMWGVEAKLYDKGGVWQPGTWGFNGSGAPERVLSPAETAGYGTFLPMGSGGAGGVTVNIDNRGGVIGVDHLEQRIAAGVAEGFGEFRRSLHGG